jgi:HlyD family secretion protein
MHAYFMVDAYPGQRFEGSVRQIRNAATTVQNVVTYDAVIDVLNPELKLRPGMTANVTFVYASQDDALRTANAALRFKPSAELLGPKPGSKNGPDAAKGMNKRATPSLTSTARRHEAASEGRTLWVLRENKPQPVTVKLGITDGTRTEIVDGGLREGDQVITDILGAPTGAGSSSAPGGAAPNRRGGFGRIL